MLQSQRDDRVLLPEASPEACAVVVEQGQAPALVLVLLWVALVPIPVGLAGRRLVVVEFLATMRPWPWLELWPWGAEPVVQVMEFGPSSSWELQQEEQEGEEEEEAT